jgi:hypothetical protein
MSTLKRSQPTGELVIDPFDYLRVSGIEQWIINKLVEAGAPLKWLKLIPAPNPVRGIDYEITGTLVRLNQHDGKMLFQWRSAT